ncbi:MAG TPA: Clp protease N-terminal domain-containing protein [Acidimicrobiales bacterium]
MDLDELVAAVESGSTEDPLDRLSAAAALKRDIEALGDELLDHFVREARTGGCSWAQIGDALGVTRQAAQQRHGGFLGRLVKSATGRIPMFRRFTERARAVVVTAQHEARARHAEQIDTEHVLLALAQAEGCVAAQALDRCGVDRPALCRLVDERTPAGTRVGGHIPFSADCKKALELGLREALRLGHHHLGTEHILLGLLRVKEGHAATLLAEVGVTQAAATEAVVAVLDEPPEASSG